jgi:transcriptional regulator with XRE-family HTH domain
MDVISKNIRKIRREKGITQIQLSQMIGSTNDYISKLERGLRKNPSSNMLNKIAKALNVSVQKLYKENNEDDSIEEILNNIYNNVPDTELPLSALIVKQFIKEGLIDNEGNMSPKVKKLLLEAIALQSKVDNVKKD